MQWPCKHEFCTPLRGSRTPSALQYSNHLPSLQVWPQLICLEAFLTMLQARKTTRTSKGYSAALGAIMNATRKPRQPVVQSCHEHTGEQMRCVIVGSKESVCRSLTVLKVDLPIELHAEIRQHGHIEDKYDKHSIAQGEEKAGQPYEFRVKHVPEMT